ncbi:Histidine triad, conserved site-containing protein [Cynara cardunculus var. scolymus]|uniref:Bis(5'-adenosyl)-triphosphatase n=1 Tax=Cynara cardunculus var. scolymus TaxID=59895 RepID=A0A118JW45_CYNCS|nr:Histidine triad, conserved site-containing protein [Cynara cardunculus var. scolymus]
MERLPSLLSPLSSFRSSAALRPVASAAAAHFQIARASFGSSGQMEAEQYKFGPYKIDSKEVFYSTDLSYALVNLRPLLPGNSITHNPLLTFYLFLTYSHFLSQVISLNKHALAVLHYMIRTHVLVCPRREVKRFVDLTTEETSDLWISAQKIGRLLENYHKASSLTFAIQDGPQAGQTVPHVHIHIVPRKGGDFENNDEIYEAIDEKEKELKKTLDLDKERKDRSMEEMAKEADEYRKLFS